MGVDPKTRRGRSRAIGHAVKTAETLEPALEAKGPTPIDALVESLGAMLDQSETPADAAADEVRLRGALVALRVMGEDAARATHAIEPLLESERPALREGAIRALAAIGAKSGAHVDLLRRIADADSSASVRSAAEDALTAFDWHA